MNAEQKFIKAKAGLWILLPFVSLFGFALLGMSYYPVSYTHLTLPTN